MDPAQPTGWRTKPAPVFLGEPEEHQNALPGWAAGVVDVGVDHRRTVGLYPPEVWQEYFEGIC